MAISIVEPFELEAMLYIASIARGDEILLGDRLLAEHLRDWLKMPVDHWSFNAITGVQVRCRFELVDDSKRQEVGPGPLD
jgi:hypothetical protein